MKLIEYINNPMGKGSSVMPLREIQKSLDDQYEQLKDQMKMVSFIKNKRFLILVINVPSRHVKGLFYNVVFEFDLEGIADTESTIGNLDFKCFSNCPSFSYTYARAFKKKDMLCNWLTSKYDKKIFSMPSETRNQNELIGYERSLYLAAKFAMRPSRNKLSFLKMVSMTLTGYNRVNSLISTQQEIEEQYKILTQRQKKERDIKKSKNKINSKNKNTGDGIIKSVKSTKTTDTIKRSKKTNKI